LYFYNHFPQAVAVALEMQDAGWPASFAYTTHPWLVSEFLTGEANCSHFRPTDVEIQLIEDAIEQDIFRWHGKPMNIFPELTDSDFFEDALSIRTDLNLRFNKSWGSITAKSTDVPGLSQSVIPIMAKAGIQAVHMGYNWACHTADVPPIFVWKHEETGTDVIAMVEDSYGNFVYTPELPEALAFLYTMDNGNPPDFDTIINFWASLTEQFPTANIKLSSLDEFAERLMTVKDKLPVYTGEIGDTWSV
jgi:hypothetical protein